MIRFSAKSRIAAMLAAVVVLGTAWMAHAQTVPQLENRIEKLEKQLRAVQRRVFSGDDVYFSTGSEVAGSGAAASQDQGAMPSGEPNLLADLQIRLSALERQLRELTGRVEEQGFQTRQMETELTRFREDVEFRLGQLERGSGQPSLQPTAPALQGGAAAGGPNDVAPPRPTSPAPNPSAQNTPTPEPAPESAPKPAPEPAPAPEPQPQPEPVATSPQTVFEDAFAALRRGDYADAESGFQTFLRQYPQDPLASNAQYWLGRSYFVRRDYGRAAGAFLSSYQDYPNGEKAADSLLDLGVTLIELDQKQDACAAFEQFQQSFPNASDRLQQRLASERARAGCG